jgi:hypothetical protein
VRAAAALLLLLLAATGAPAGETPPAEAAGGPAEEIRREREDTARRAIGLWGAGYSWPFEVYGSVSFLLTEVPASYDCATTCKFDGLLIQLEPSFEAVRLNLGYAVAIGETGKLRPFLAKTYLAYGINASLVRTFSNSTLDPPEQTLLGAEGVFTITNVNFSVGLYHHVAGGEPDRPWLLTIALGYGF